MIIITKIKSIFLSIVIIALTIGSTILIQNRKTKAQETTETTPKIGIAIVLDAGHGGVDPGSVGKITKITESELNLSIVNKLESLFVSAGIEVIKTRTDSNGLYGVYSKDYKIRDMKARKEIISSSNANMLISVHMNSFVQTKQRGAQVFYDTGNEMSEVLALSIQNCFTADLPESNKGISIGDYYILKCDSSLPSVLCECGYLSNPDDEKLLITEEYQVKVAYAIYKGAIAYLNINT